MAMACWGLVGLITRAFILQSVGKYDRLTLLVDCNFWRGFCRGYRIACTGFSSEGITSGRSISCFSRAIRRLCRGG